MLYVTRKIELLWYVQLRHTPVESPLRSRTNRAKNRRPSWTTESNTTRLPHDGWIKAKLSNGQTGQLPRTPHFWGPRAFQHFEQ